MGKPLLTATTMLAARSETSLHCIAVLACYGTLFYYDEEVGTARLKVDRIRAKLKAA